MFYLKFTVKEITLLPEIYIVVKHDLFYLKYNNSKLNVIGKSSVSFYIGVLHLVKLL